MTETIPCKAQDKTKCPYHGAIIRADKALTKGNMNDYLQAQEDMTKAARTSPEVKAFFNLNHKAEKPAEAPASKQDDLIPEVTADEIAHMLRISFRGLHDEDGPAAIKTILGILSEPATGMHPNHDKYDRIKAVLKEHYEGQGENGHRIYFASKKIFLANGLIVTESANKDTIITDEQTAQKVHIHSDEIKIGDVLQVDESRYAVSNIYPAHRKGNGPTLVLQAMRTGRKPLISRGIVLETEQNTDYTVLR